MPQRNSAEQPARRRFLTAAPWEHATAFRCVEIGYLGAAEFRDALGLEPLITLYDYWLARSCGQRLPRRADIDPLDLAPILPWIYLLDVADGRYRVRVGGTALRDLFDAELTGLDLLEALPAHHRANAQRSYGLVVSERMAWCGINTYQLDLGEAFRMVRLALPLSSTGETIDRILGGIAWNSADTAGKPVWELLMETDGVTERREIAFRPGNEIP